MELQFRFLRPYLALNSKNNMGPSHRRLPHCKKRNSWPTEDDKLVSSANKTNNPSLCSILFYSTLSSLRATETKTRGSQNRNGSLYLFLNLLFVHKAYFDLCLWLKSVGNCRARSWLICMRCVLNLGPETIKW